MNNPTTGNKIEGITFEQYLFRVARRIEISNTRAGQAYFAELQDLHPEWALAIVNSPANADLDPFYNDRNIGEFLRHVCTMWGVKGGVVFHHGTPMSKGRPV